MEGLKRAAMNMCAIYSKDRFTKSPLERLLLEATTNDNWGAPTSLLHQIAEKTFSNYEDQAIVLRYMWESLKAPSKEWRRLYKVLHLVEHLLRFGSTGCVQDIKDGSYKLREMLEFSYNEEGVERGSGIRDKAKAVMALVQDHRLLEEERESARKQMSRYVGISSDDFNSRGGSGYGSNSGGYNSGGSGYSSNPMQGFGNPSFGNRAPVESRSSYDSPATRGYDSEPRFSERSAGQSRDPPQAATLFKSPATQVSAPISSIFEPPKSAQQQPNLFDSAKPAPKSAVNIFEAPKVTQKTDTFSVSQTDIFAPVGAKRSSPASNVDIFAPVTKTENAQISDIFSVQTAAPTQLPAFSALPQATFQAATSTGNPQIYTVPTARTTAPIPVYPQVAHPTVPAPAASSQTIYPGQFPVYQQGVSAPPQTPVETPKVKIHHNMGSYSGPSIAQLKTTPSMKGDFSEFQSAAPAPKPPADLESMLTNLDNLQIEPKKKDDPRDYIGF